jgi:hypothetical protein
MRLADHGEPARARPDDRGVERAPAQVVDGDRRAGVRPAGDGVGGGGRDRLGHEAVDPEVDVAQRLAQQVELELAPVGRVGHRQRRRPPTLGLGHPADHPLDHPGHQQLGRHRRPGQEQRGRVAEAALELARHPIGIGDGPAGGRLADE